MKVAKSLNAPALRGWIRAYLPCPMALVGDVIDSKKVPPRDAVAGGVTEPKEVIR